MSLVLIDRDELLKHEVMIITKGNAAFHGVPSSLIETAPVVYPAMRPGWSTPDKKPTREDADEDGHVLAVHKGWTGEASKWLFSVVANHPENFYCWYPMPTPPAELLDVKKTEEKDG